MSGVYANKTCVDCGIRRPANLMRRKSRTVEGTIGGGISGNPFAKNVRRSIRVSSSRRTVRTKEVWICGHRKACDDPDYYNRIYEAELEKARKVAEQEAERARKVAEQEAEQARKDAEQAERDRIARETEEKIAGLSTEICDWVNSGKIKDKHEVDVDKISDLKQRFEEKINTEYSKLPHLNQSQKRQYSDFVTKTVNSKKLGSFLYVSGSSISTPLVNALPSAGKIKKGFLWGLVRLILWIVLFVSSGWTFSLYYGLGTFTNNSGGHDVSVVEDQSKSETYVSPSALVETYTFDVDPSKSEIYASSLFVKFLNLLAITKDQEFYSLPSWHDLEEIGLNEVEREGKLDFLVTQQATPFDLKESTTTRFQILGYEGYGGNANISKLEFTTHEHWGLLGLFDILSKIENVEILDTRCDSKSTPIGDQKYAIIEFADHKPIYVDYGMGAGSGGTFQWISFEILEKSNRNLPELGTSDRAMGVWEVCNVL